MNAEPAFPIIDVCVNNGLTKRELFAAMAMCAMISRDHYSGDETIAPKKACQYADALLAELEKAK